MPDDPRPPRRAQIAALRFFGTFALAAANGIIGVELVVKAAGLKPE